MEAQVSGFKNGNSYPNSVEAERVINQRYKGDKIKFQRWLTTASSEAISFKDLSVSEKCCPELNQECIKAIYSALGYLPPLSSYFPYKAFIQVLLSDFHNGNIIKEDFDKELKFYIELIDRNFRRVFGELSDSSPC